MASHIVNPCMTNMKVIPYRMPQMGIKGGPPVKASCNLKAGRFMLGGATKIKNFSLKERHVTQKIGETGLSTATSVKCSTNHMVVAAEGGSQDRVGVFWDAAEKLKVPDGLSFLDTVSNLKEFLHECSVDEPITSFIVYGDASDPSLPHSSNVKIEEDSVGVEFVVKNDLAEEPLWIANSLVTDMFMFALDNPAMTSKVLVLSEKEDILPACNELTKRGYRVILCI